MSVQPNSTTASSFASTLLGVSLVNVLLDSLSTIQPALVSDVGTWTLSWDLLLTLIPGAKQQGGNIGCLRNRVGT